MCDGRFLFKTTCGGQKIFNMKEKPWTFSILIRKVGHHRILHDAFSSFAALSTTKGLDWLEVPLNTNEADKIHYKQYHSEYDK